MGRIIHIANEIFPMGIRETGKTLFAVGYKRKGSVTLLKWEDKPLAFDTRKEAEGFIKEK